MPKVHAIYTYPIKSLEGMAVRSSKITAGGSLLYDREFAFFDGEQKFIKGKNAPELFKVRVSYDLPRYTAFFSFEGSGNEASFNLLNDTDKIQSHFGNYFNKAVRFSRNTHSGFPDDVAASGPTFVSLASLHTVAGWFPGLTVEEIIRRFRVNIIIDDAPAFWEDKLFGLPGEVQPFSIGDVQFHGTNPCARCPVPTRDSRTGEILTGFQKRFAEMRQATLPPWSEPSRFDHYYRFTINTVMPPAQEGKTIHVGDEVIIG
ncbi:MAG: MOSC N-terminal beta barrel domain-containing protein [Ignavibacteriales bacterium]|nr:MOSC N-terminal beta barrel domain-containing protein [Ignavibacteriales bacterium]